MKNTDFDFFKTTMPKTRPADYYLGCLDGSVFIDFNQTKGGCIELCRISFDGFGCCRLEQRARGLNSEDSQQFIAALQQDELDQEAVTALVKKLIHLNQKYIWADALERYDLLT